MTLDKIERTLKYCLVALTACLAAVLILRPGPSFGADIAAILLGETAH